MQRYINIYTKSFKLKCFHCVKNCKIFKSVFNKRHPYCPENYDCSMKFPLNCAKISLITKSTF